MGFRSGRFRREFSSILKTEIEPQSERSGHGGTDSCFRVQKAKPISESQAFKRYD
jgi:hypothetical protein